MINGHTNVASILRSLNDSGKSAHSLIVDKEAFALCFPILARLEHLSGGLKHGENVLEHCLDTWDALKGQSFILRVAGLFHDCGKADTAVAQSDGHTTFHKHETVGAEVAYNFMLTTGFTHEEASFVSLVIRHHMFRFDLTDSGKPRTKNKTVMKWLAKVGKHYKDIFLLRLADRKANKAKAGKNLITDEMAALFAKVEELLGEKQDYLPENIVLPGGNNEGKLG